MILNIFILWRHSPQPSIGNTAKNYLEMKYWDIFSPIQFYSQVSNKVFVEDIKLQVLQKSQ